MKKIISTILSLVMVISCFSMLSVTAFAASDGNDSTSKATGISVNQYINGNVESSSDYDYYRFTLTQAGYVNITFNHNDLYDANSYWRVWLYDVNGDEVDDEWNIAGNATSTTTHNIGLPAGTYYICISDGYSYRDTSGYSFKVNFVASNYWEKEFNGSTKTADAINVNTEYKGTVKSSSDYDYYRFTLTQTGEVTITFSHGNIADANSYWRVWLYDVNGDEVDDEWNIAGNVTSTTTHSIGLPTGTYYVCVSDGYSYCSNEDYSFKVNFSVADDWEQEDNDSTKNADSININSVYKGTVKSSSDYDYYKFTLTNAGKVSITFLHEEIADANSYWRVWLYDVNGDEVDDEWNIAGNKSSTTTHNIGLPAGTYYVCVSDGYSYYSSKNYSFKVNFTATEYWEREFNGGTTTANPISLDKTYSGTVKSSSDYDYYRLTLTQSTKVKVTFSHQVINDADDYWKVSLRDGNNEEIDAVYSYGNIGSVEIPAQILSSGNYYICITDGDECSNADYKFTVATVKEPPATPEVSIKNTNSGIKVSWNAVDTATSYIIYRKTYDDSTASWGSWKNIKSGYTSTSYTDKETLLGVKYKYTVKAVNGGGKSGIVSTTALQCDMVPAVKISNASNGISVTWNKINGAQSYIIYRKAYDASTANWDSWKNIKSGYTSTSYTDTDAVFGVKYKYTVKAVRNGVKSSKKSTGTLQRNVSPTVSIANKASGVKVSWNSIYGAQSYIVYRKTYNDSTKAWGSWECLKNNCTSTSYVDKKAVLGAKYKYTTLAVRDGFKGSFVETALLQRNVSPTVETANASNGIKVTWNSIYGAQKYIVYRKTYNDSTKAWGSWEVLTSNCTATNYTDTKALLGVNYKYTVVAVRGNFNSTFVETTLIQRNVSPVVKTANASNGIKVTWNSIYGAQSYIVYRKTYNDSTAKWGAWESVNGKCTSTSYVDTKAALGVKYMYTVVAVRNGVKSSFVATNELQRNVSPSVKISNKADGVNVTWNAINGAQSYIVYRNTYDASAKTWSGWKKIKENCTVTSYADKTALLGVQYKYTVRAVRGDFKSSYVGTSVLQRNVSPAVSVVNQATGVKISWNSVYGAQSYIVYRKTYNTSTEKWGSWEAINGKCTSTSYVDKKALLGERYKYTVVAVRGNFKSTFTETPMLQINVAPTVTIAKQSNGIKVNWTSVYGVQNYIVYRKTYNSATKTWGSWQPIKTGCTGTSMVDTSVKNGTYYRYTVCGVRNGFQGTFVQSSVLQYVK